MAKVKQTSQSTPDSISAFADMSGDALKNMFGKDLFGRATALSGDLSGLAHANMEAMTQSLQAASKGMVEINTKAFGFMQANLQRNLETMRTVSKMKSAEDMSALQDMTKDGFSTYFAQMNELGSLFAGTLRKASEPLNVQAGAVVDKLQATA